MICRPDDPELASVVESKGAKEQKALLQRIFADAGWETPRILADMHEADDFYMEHIAQVKCSSWAHGRVALVGDAGFCPSPFSAMGSSPALYGAYILAGELGPALRGDIPVEQALRNYERVGRPYVTEVQNTVKHRLLKMILPQSSWGVWFLNTVIASIYWSGLPKLLLFLPTWSATETSKLPTYEWAPDDSQ